MATATQVKLLTAEEFGEQYSGRRVELIDGRVEDLPMPGVEHGAVCVNLTIDVGGFIRTNQLGVAAGTDTFVLVGRNPDRVRGADLAFWASGRIPEGKKPKGVVDVPPDLVFEVKSPTDRWRKIAEKVSEYLNADVRVVVVIDPETESATVYRPDEIQQVIHNGDELTLPDVLPGFAVPVKSLFQ